MVEMTVHRVGLCMQDSTPVIVLRERHGERFLPVKVSTMHANAAIRHSHRLPPFRPQTHEVFVAVLRAMGATIAGAQIEAGDEDALTAQLTVTRGARTITLPATAADAVVLAVRAEAPIFAAPGLLERFAQPQPRDEIDCAQRPPKGPQPQASEHAMPAGPPKTDVFRQFIETLSNIDKLENR